MKKILAMLLLPAISFAYQADNKSKQYWEVKLKNNSLNKSICMRFDGDYANNFTQKDGKLVSPNYCFSDSIELEENLVSSANPEEAAMSRLDFYLDNTNDHPAYRLTTEKTSGTDRQSIIYDVENWSIPINPLIMNNPVDCQKILVEITIDTNKASKSMHCIKV